MRTVVETTARTSKASRVRTADPSAAVGPRIKALRDAMGFSLRDLAERSGVSAPMLSQVERGETSPTLAVAEKIAAGLELTELTPPLPGQRADVSLHVLDPGAATGGREDPPMHEPGSRETTVVLAGTLALVVDGIRHDLREGDSVTFDADLPHHFENDGDEATRFLAVIAAGLRRS